LPVFEAAGTLRVPSAKYGREEPGRLRVAAHNLGESAKYDKEVPGRLRVAAHNLGEPMAVRPRVLCCRILQKTRSVSTTTQTVRRSRCRWRSELGV
jgi:hypothetical protein